MVSGPNRARPGKRPVLDLPPTSTDIVLEILSALGMLVLVYLFVHAWATLPETIPTHFDIHGEPDGWGSKSTLVMLPIIALVLYAFMTIINRYPHVFNYIVPITEENAERQYRLGQGIMRWVKLEVVWLFVYIEWATIRTANGQGDGFGILFVPIVVIVLFGTTGTFIWQSVRVR